MFTSALVFVILLAGVLVMAAATAGAVKVCRSDDERNAAIGKK